MKPLGVIVSGILFLLFGSATAVFSQEPHGEEAKPSAHQEEPRPAPHPETAAPAARQEAPRPAPHPEARPQAPAAHQAPAPQVHPESHPQARPATPPPHVEEHSAAHPAAHPATPPPRHTELEHQQQPNHPGPTPEQRRIAQTAWQSHRAQQWQTEHRTWQQRGGYRGYRIPDDRYRSYFGPSHVFPIYSVPVTVVGGFPRFQYQGFWFTVIDPWPADWGDNWYYNDNVYIVYEGGGYYLCNPAYPGVLLAVNVAA